MAANNKGLPPGRDVGDIWVLKDALPYLKAYRGRTFVVKMGGELLGNERNLADLAEELSLLYQFGIRMVIIHGGGPQMSRLAAMLGVETKIVAGRRITDDSTLEVAKMVLGGQISTDILSHLRRHGTKGVGLTGVDGDLIIAERRPVRRMLDPETGKEEDVDFQNVGDIREVHPEVLAVLLERWFVPVIASLGADEEGKVLNINADTVACEVAKAVRAEKLFILSNVNGVLRNMDDPSSRYSYLTVDQGEELIRTGTVRGGMIPKLRSAIDAVRGGVPRAHILNGLLENSLLTEVFTRKGFGTMIIATADEAEYLEKG